MLIWVFQEADANWVKHARNLSEEMESQGRLESHDLDAGLTPLAERVERRKGGWKHLRLQCKAIQQGHSRALEPMSPVRRCQCHPGMGLP